MTNNRIQRYTVSGDIAYPIHEDPEGDYVTYEDHVAAIEADRKRRGEPVDKGPWKAGVNRSDKRTFIESDDFTHDVRLYVDGDFADQDEKLAYALGVADQLNAAPQPAEPVKMPSDGERAAQGLPPYNPRKPTEEEWSRLIENGRKAWRKNETEPVKVSDDLACEIWAAAQAAPGEGIEAAVERVAALLARYTTTKE